MSAQCDYCGAPLRGRQACGYCGTAARPPEPVAYGSPALCVCQVLATGRCTFCDTPVCAPHTDSYWRGRGEQTPLQDAAEQSIWAWATSEPAELIWGTGTVAHPQACTVCRSINAEQAIDRYRQTGSHGSDFERQLAAYSCGIFCNLLARQPTIAMQTAPALDYLRSRNWPREPMAAEVEWKRKRKTVSFTPVQVDSGFLVPGVPIRNRPADPEAIMIFEQRSIWILLGNPLVESQPIEGGARMFFHPPCIAGLPASDQKRGRMTLSMLLGVDPSVIDSYAPMPDRFWAFWEKLLVSLAGLSPLEHVDASGWARLAAADLTGGAIQPRFPPHL